ncbi:protein of unknown function [Hyphomicrobium sp. MC1]|nr:protein of unknown function [Hyphomicrobium sp. MC1]
MPNLSTRQPVMSDSDVSFEHVLTRMSVARKNENTLEDLCCLPNAVCSFAGCLLRR